HIAVSPGRNEVDMLGIDNKIAVITGASLYLTLSI
ncbi:hypothetical protein LCGC14_2996230, partial [marine sediment metagenome]